jgi:hypothetical protein
MLVSKNNLSIIKRKKAHACKIPLIVWLLENFQSILSLPGKISLEDHDYLHLLLDCDRSPTGEALAIGFCMGGDPDTKKIHVLIFKFFARYIYPKVYRLTKEDLTKFDLGFDYGKKIYRRNQIPLNQIKSSQFSSVKQARNSLGIDLSEPKTIMSSLQGKNNRNLDKKHLIKLLRISSSICAVLGGFLVASKLTISGYGFIILALSSSQLLISSILDRDNFLVFYSGAVFIFVDLYGVYRWLLS